MSQPTVAIIGASTDRSKFGNKSVRAHLQQGYEVFPVNPKGGENRRPDRLHQHFRSPRRASLTREHVRPTCSWHEAG